MDCVKLGGVTQTMIDTVPLFVTELLSPAAYSERTERTERIDSAVPESSL